MDGNKHNKWWAVSPVQVLLHKDSSNKHTTRCQHCTETVSFHHEPTKHSNQHTTQRTCVQHHHKTRRQTTRSFTSNVLINQKHNAPVKPNTNTTTATSSSACSISTIATRYQPHLARWPTTPTRWPSIQQTPMYLHYNMTYFRHVMIHSSHIMSCKLASDRNRFQYWSGFIPFFSR